MDNFFDYLKLYITNKFHCVPQSNKKYLVVESYENGCTVFNIGMIYNHYDCQSNGFCYNFFDDIIIYNEYNCNKWHSFDDTLFYELADDFSYEHCDDIIQTHYDICNDHNNNIDTCYVIKFDHLILVTNSIELYNDHHWIESNIKNPFLNNSYKLKIIGKNNF